MWRQILVIFKGSCSKVQSHNGKNLTQEKLKWVSHGFLPIKFGVTEKFTLFKKQQSYHINDIHSVLLRYIWRIFQATVIQPHQIFPPHRVENRNQTFLNTSGTSSTRTSKSILPKAKQPQPYSTELKQNKIECWNLCFRYTAWWWV